MRCVLLAALLASAALAPGARAELRPKWEAGAGATGLRLPDYRGSDETREYVFPLPYFVYRGQYMRFDREGLRGVLHEPATLRSNSTRSDSCSTPRRPSRSKRMYWPR